VKLKLLLRGKLYAQNQSLKDCYEVIRDYFRATQMFYEEKLSAIDKQIEESQADMTSIEKLEKEKSALDK
jgi:hypothetical protein